MASRIDGSCKPFFIYLMQNVTLSRVFIYSCLVITNGLQINTWEDFPTFPYLLTRLEFPSPGHLSGFERMCTGSFYNAFKVCNPV